MLFQYWLILVAFSACVNSTNIKEQSQSSKRKIDGANWMRDNIDVLGKRTLNEICMPGSHDSGMSSFYSGTSMAHSCNVLTQSLPIRGQLENGARYFDVRPDLVSGNGFQTGHYLKLPGGKCIGGNGQSIASIVNDINQFIASHNELVIVKLSHSLNSNRCGFFSMLEWESVFRILDQTLNLYFNDDEKIRLDKLTLNHFTNNGNKGAVLYIVSEDEVKLWYRLGRGFYYDSNLNIYDEYSNTNLLPRMMEDQIKKMKEESKNYFFILSWTLTLSVRNALFCRIKYAKSIRELAVQAHNSLPNIISEVNSTAFPNVLYVDDIKDTDIVSVAMDITNKLEV
ncbi:uncharacterized protein [Halyomorpha halys]|uniref:uncharacterized protein n=1 Tax=Halyomorpha halys TaxID=286706 RepID=UPI0006D50DA1|nr:uncharacterized protein LOC106678613 [Halyomorpha halys]